jgi:lysophospholipase L1-like esterase
MIGLGLAGLMAAAPRIEGAEPAEEREPRPETSSAAGLPLSLADEETIVFFGDSITEQNLYTAFMETFLVSRFPGKKIACFNFGWGGDTALGGNQRFARDVVPVRPSLVFVNFGMNDGGYKPYEETIYQSYIEAQRALATTIGASGARQTLFTTSPVDDVLRGDGGAYNEALSRMADGVTALGGERGIPVIDLLHPMLDIQRRAKKGQPGFTMIPDTIHPNAVGHLVMAYLALRQIEAPRLVSDIVVENEKVTETGGATVSNVTVHDDAVELDLALPFLPFFVPPEARAALDMVPLEDELNRFRLRLLPTKTRQPMILSVDGKTLGTFTAEQLERGVDLALLDNAPWAQAGRTLWQTAQLRWAKHQESWRRMGIEKPAYMMPALPSFEPLCRAQRAYADELGRSLGELVRPGSYHLALRLPGELVTISKAEISPAYPYESFDTVYPPERAVEEVPWKTVPFINGQIDLGGHLARSTYVVAYVRVVLEADRPCTLHLAMGSDDGLAVFLDGRRVFAHDVQRSLKPGEDEVEAPLVAGRNVLLFKVTQGGGDFGLAVEARVHGRGKVRQIAR